MVAGAGSLWWFAWPRVLEPEGGGCLAAGWRTSGTAYLQALKVLSDLLPGDRELESDLNPHRAGLRRPLPSAVRTPDWKSVEFQGC